MTAFTDHGIGLLEGLDRKTGARLSNMTRGGYALVTRRHAPDDLIQDLHRGYAMTGAQIRIRDTVGGGYQPPRRAYWESGESAPSGVDVLVNQELICKTFPSCAADVATVIHIRRAGSISAQQLGQFMLEEIRGRGARLLRAEVKGIAEGSPFTLELATAGSSMSLRADKIVNAAGPMLRDIARPSRRETSRSSARVPAREEDPHFQDREGAIPRDLPFTIDLDGQTLAWSDEDRALLAAEPSARHLVLPMRGGIHCRPDGAVDGTWIKLGWAYNDQASDPHLEEPVDPQFPDTALRGASRLHPGLSAYIGRLPRGARHYGGYYTMTDENWPLIGPMKTPGAFIAAALSGFGSMAACSTGALCAAWVAGRPVPELRAAALKRRTLR